MEKWLDKYEYGGQAGYTDIPFKYNSAWGGQFQTGGSLPGSVGFTYARTQGIPSNGPYAKKTLASAQDGTKLTKAEEEKYQSWRSKLPKNLQWEGDYDLKGLWKANPKVKPSPNLHFPDTYKLPNHPTFSNESKYYDSVTPGVGGYWGEGEENFIKNPQIGPPVPHAENGMTYYQHGLDWKPKTISRDGSEVPKNQNAQYILSNESTSLGTSRRDAELLDQIARRKEFEKYIGSQPQIKESTKSTPAQEKERIRKNKEYAAQLPNAKVDEQGNISRINPNRSVTGEAENFMSRREDKAGEHALGALEAAGYAEGLGALGSAAKKAIAQSMESGILSNTYKLNPWAFKTNPEAYYRGIGRTGLDDALESGVLRSNRKGNFGNDLYLSSSFDEADYYANNKLPWTIREDGKVVDDLIKGKGIDTNKYFAEIPKQNINVTPYHINDTQFISKDVIPVDKVKLLQKDWLRGYKEVPKPITETLPSPQQAGFLNPLAIADAVVPRINPFSFVEDGGDLMSMSPLNFVPGYGKNLGGKNQAFRKFGNSIQDVIERQALSPKGGSSLRVGKNQIVSEGNWAAPDRPWEKYPGVFEATFDFTHPERNIGMQGFKNRSGVLITDRQGNPLPEIPITEPGMSFNRRLPFSTRYVPIDKQKLIDNKFQLATFAPHLQSLAEKYAVGLGGAATLGAMGYPDAVEKYNQYTIDPIKNWTKEQWEDYKKSDVYKKFRELDESVGLDFLYDKKKEGGVIKDDMGQWAHPGKITEIGSNQITMQGVPYPVLGISDQGDTQMMFPEQEYKFKGKKVTEFPLKKSTGGWLDKYQ
jgi:hypothetical protein